MKILFEFEKQPLLFENPVRIITCFKPSEIAASLSKAEEWLHSGGYLAGFLSYEAGYAFEPCLSASNRYDFPLLCFGCYRSPARPRATKERHAKAGISDLRLSLSKEEYGRSIDCIRDHIRRGDVYQITYCIKMLFSFHGSSFGLYRALFRKQPVPYPAYLEADGFSILSLSPEMFIKKSGSLLVTKPMKGTWPRFSRFVPDFGGLRLKYDEKNRAENLMITDLLRNDLGRIGKGITVPRLFEVARYKTLYQMTSTVACAVDPRLPITNIFRALFPSGSVTGAPKIRAMQVIRGLEKQERRIYTGAIGYICPNRDMFFNIPIRTLLLNKGAGEMGIGGGIVWDSTVDGEWKEGLLKARFLSDLARGSIQV